MQLEQNINEIASCYRVMNDLLRANLSCCRMIQLHAQPLLPQLARSATYRNTEKEIQVADMRGRKKEEEVEPNHTTARKPGPPSIVQYSLE
jgi:hypothetical protein